MKRREYRTRVEKNPKKTKKMISIVLIPMLLFIVGGLSYAGYVYGTTKNVMKDSYEDNGRDKSNLRDSEVEINMDNITVLIMGVDTGIKRGNEDRSRTDSLLFASLNKKDKSVDLLSIPRDSYVYIPSEGKNDKIAHAHAFGGTMGTIDTVENMLDIPVDYYVKLNFDSFVDVVESLGGIEVDVPYEFTESDSNDKKDAIHLMPGEQTLNGEEALAFARTRKQDNDIERGKRQQEVIKSIADKTLSVDSLFNIDKVIKSVGENMATNMSFSEMKSLFSYVAKGDDLKINTLNLSGSDNMSNGVYYWMLDEQNLSNIELRMKEHLEIERPRDNETDKQVEEELNNL
ncbi:transcriptional regulator [Oceanobacillus sp. E9]|uniref:LCP family protein n=1 Tax=Oceanobacillus sp. E9 TaxID=1742575 RepID=UPI00084E49BE|nr:LCP family protein [Oceanobacillus sp. E9]OEH56412.1 transcriptional regulator [Oceanobacillus sp. E9]